MLFYLQHNKSLAIPNAFIEITSLCVTTHGLVYFDWFGSVPLY